MRLFTRKSLNEVRSQAGYYTMLDGDKRPIYDGCSRDCRRRLLDSLYGRSDYRQIQGKGRIRERVRYVAVEYMPINEAQAKDRRIKRRYSLK